MTAGWLLGCALAGLLLGAGLRGTVFSFTAPPGTPTRVTCPGCGGRLRRRIGSLSAVTLGPNGRCPHCRAPIGPPAALLELATATGCALVAVRYQPGPVAVAFLWLAAVGVALSAIDLAAHRLPDALTLRSYPVLLALFGFAATTGAGGHRLVTALLGMVGSLALYLLLAVVPASSMGLGDVKFSGLLGLALGWVGATALLTGVLLGALLAGAVGLMLIATGRAGWRTRLPFGPFMFAGAFVVIVH